jgi:hypothetical protein
VGTEWFCIGTGREQVRDIGPGIDALGDGFEAVAARLDPDIVAVLGPGTGTDAQILAHAWAAGVPALVLEDSCLAGAVRQFGGGRTAPGDDPTAVGAGIVGLLDVARSAEVDVSPAAKRTHLTAAEDYRTRIYRPSQADLPMIGVVSARGLGTTEVRTGRMAAAAEELGLATLRWADPHDVATGADDTAYDAVVVQRAAVPAPDAARLIDRLTERATRLVVEVDDDLVSPAARSRLDTHYEPERLDALADLARAADHIIASTAHLAGVMRRFAEGVPASVVENRLDPRLWFTVPESGKARAECRPVYVGTATHGADLALLEGVPALVGEHLGRAIEFDLVGVTAGPLPAGFRRIGNPSTRYEQFVPWLRRQSSRWNIGLAPLAADPFNDSKSDLKLLEYAALGLAAVASARGPYAGAQELAITVDDDAPSWALAISSLLRADRWREAAKGAHESVWARRSIDRDWAEFWIATICGTV